MTNRDTFYIETDRLILRPFCAADLPDMASWASDPAVQIEYGEPVYPDKDAVAGLLQKYIEAQSDSENFRWSIVLRETGHGIGQIGFCRVYADIRTAEIEYCIAALQWGHGYAGEALDAVIRWTFAQTDFAKLEAYHRAENEKSGRVLQKSCMHKTDNVERFRRTNETPIGEICYCIERGKPLETHANTPV